MSLMFFSIACLLLVIFSLQPITCAIPTNIQTLESNDISTLPDQFVSVIDKLKQTVSRFRCPKGWKRLGGSCYYYSNLTSTSTHVNHTCNYIHSNYSNLIQIQNAVELFYAAHVLSRNNLTSLMIEIHPNLLKGKKITDMLMNDEGRWERMKKLFPEVRAKYQRLKKEIIDRLSSIGLRVLRRSKKIKPIPPKQDVIHNETYDNQNDEYEYDDLDSSDETDEFEQIENIRGICDDIHWNVLNNNNNTKNTTVYILTKYIMSDKIICSLSDIEPQRKYHYICEYVIDFCFANILCGKHGNCVNTLQGFKCACSFLYGGLFCERITQQGKQIIIGLVIIGILGPIPYLIFHIRRLIKKKCGKTVKQTNENREDSSTHPLKSVQVGPNITIIHNQESSTETSQKVISSSSNSSKSDLMHSILVGILSVLILSILYSIILLRYYILFQINAAGFIDSKNLLNITIHLANKCTRISDYRITSLILAPCACVLILMFFFLTKSRKSGSEIFYSRCELPPPIVPFSIKNRFITAMVFGVLAFEVLKIFEGLFLNLDYTAKLGVLVELLMRIGTIVLVGLQYYPVLISIHLHNITIRFLICLYMIGIIIYTIIREGSCMGYIPLSGQYSFIEEAKLRVELGTWFILYGLLKNTPHFFFLSYITAELCVRFVYDSIYIALKDGRYTWSLSDKSNDDLEFSILYVKKLLRKKCRSSQIYIEKKKVNQSCFKKFINFIYVWDDDFRFTTMVVCTYTVAIVFLYYLAWTFVFVYISRTTGHIAFIKYYIESSANIQLPATPFKPEIIASAIVTVIIHGIQLLLGIQQYKIDKKELQENISKRIPPMKYFDPNVIASNSVHYSGFLIGYMAWGFVICSHLILLILIVLRIIYLQPHYATIVLGIIVPIVVFYLLKTTSMNKIGDSLLIEQEEEIGKRSVKNLKSYSIFIYFMFFADCFLGITSCIIRLIKATLANLLFMARIDYCVFGKPLDKYDDGYAAYVSYLYMELNCTHPLKHAFCSLCWDAINKKPRMSFNEKYCATVNDDDKCEEPREYRFQQKKTKCFLNICRQNKTNDESIQSITHNAHELQTKIMPNTSSRLQENESLHALNRASDKTNLFISKTMPTPIPQNSALTTDNDNQNTGHRKSTQQTFNTSNNQVELDENDGSSTSQIPSSNVTESTIRRELQSKTDNTNNVIDEDDDDDDDDGGINMKKIKKQKQKEEAKKAKKNDKEKKKQSSKTEDSVVVVDDDDDEDGAMSKHKLKIKEPKIKKKSMFTKCFHDQNTDDSISKQKDFINKKPSNKSNISKKHENDDEEDEDGGRIVKTYDTIQMLIQPKKPVLDNSKAKDKSSNGTTSDSTIQSSECKKVTTSKSKKSINNQDAKSMETNEKNRDDAVQTVEKFTVQTITDSSTANRQKSSEYKLYLLRTISYCQAQQRSPPVVTQQLLNTSSMNSQNKIDDHDDHYTEIKDNAIRLSFNNTLYSVIQVMQSLIGYSSEQQTSIDENHSEIQNEKEQQKRSKVARNRWYLAYTLIYNQWLSKLRKKALELEQLRFECSPQNSQINQQVLKPVTTNKKSVSTTIGMKSETLRSRRMRTNTATSFKAQPPAELRLLPLPNTDNE